MKTVLAFLVFIIGQTGIAATNFEVQRFSFVADNFVALSKDCQKIFVTPISYAVEPRRSSILYSLEVKQVGAIEKVIPKLIMNLNLRPTSKLSPADVEQKIRSWAAEDSVCETSTAAIEVYPDLLKTLTGNPTTQYRMTDYRWNEDQSIFARFEVLALETNPSELLKRLDAEAMFAMNFDIYQLETEVSAKLSIGYDAMTEFAQHNYTEQVCTTRQKCWFSVFGVKLGCRTVHSCANTPKTVQVLKQMALRSEVLMEVHRAADVPEFKVSQVIEDLVSKFLISNFKKTSQESIDGLTTITLGQFTKQYQNKYSDEVSSVRVVDKKVRQDLKKEMMPTVLAEQVRDQLGSKELICLRSYAKSGKTITTENPCFN